MSGVSVAYGQFSYFDGHNASFRRGSKTFSRLMARKVEAMIKSSGRKWAAEAS
jgi:hypothetical protein